MSGRVRVTLSDGRRVTGFRKTLVQRTRRMPPHLMPDWRLTFILPAQIMAASGATGIIGVTVIEGAIVECVGKRLDWVLGQGAAFLCKFGKGLMLKPVSGNLVREAEPGPTLSGPGRPAERRAVELSLRGDGAVEVVSGTAMRRLLLAA